MSKKINLKYLAGKKVAILGLGIENYALIKYLLKHKVKCEITIGDARKIVRAIYKLPSRQNIHWRLGKNYHKNLDKFNILFRSPGMPLRDAAIIKARKENRCLIISSPIKFFFDLCPTKNIVGITGTKGKGTTATLIYEIFKAAKKRVWLGGNIGVAPFEFLDKIKRGDWVVLELSSFQLEDMQTSPHLAVITNFYKEHLAPVDPHNPNYHKTLRDYRDAKLNIVKWQKKGDLAVVNNNFQFSIFNFQFRNLKSKVIYFIKSELPSKLLGEHNKENIGAAVAAARIVGIKDRVIKKVVRKFKGLEHRLEFVREVGGVKYYNDSFATTPESVIIALKSFNEPIILLAGGADKGAAFKDFARETKKKVKFVALLDGKATLRIKKELLKINFLKNKIKIVFSMREAVKVASKKANAGDIILLSPACASFGMFKNYKERGELFKEEVAKLKQSHKRLC